MGMMRYRLLDPTDAYRPACYITNSAWNYTIYETAWSEEAMRSLPLILKVYDRSGKNQLSRFLTMISEVKDGTSNDRLRKAKAAITRKLEGEEQNSWTLSGFWIGSNPELCFFMESVNHENYQRIADFKADVRDKYGGDVYGNDKVQQAIESLPLSIMSFAVPVRQLESSVIQVESFGPNQQIERQLTFTIDQADGHTVVDVMEFR